MCMVCVYVGILWEICCMCGCVRDVHGVCVCTCVCLCVRCVFVCVCCVCVGICGGQRTTSGASSHLLPYLNQGPLLFATAYVRLLGSLSFLGFVYYHFPSCLRNAGVTGAPCHALFYVCSWDTDQVLLLAQQALYSSPQPSTLLALLSPF